MELCGTSQIFPSHPMGLIGFAARVPGTLILRFLMYQGHLLAMLEMYKIQSTRFKADPG